MVPGYVVCVVLVFAVVLLFFALSAASDKNTGVAGFFAGSSCLLGFFGSLAVGISIAKGTPISQHDMKEGVISIKSLSSGKIVHDDRFLYKLDEPMPDGHYVVMEKGEGKILVPYNQDPMVSDPPAPEPCKSIDC